jgi:carbon-monoxide dehydrogenase medium subunit
VKPPLLDFVQATTLGEAAEALGQAPSEAKVIAGGQSLVPMLNLRLSRPGTLVDVGRVASLDHVDVRGDRLDVGAAVTQAALARHPAVAESWPVVREAVRHIGHAQIRSRGTVVGSIAHADPAAELPALAVALDATITLFSARGGPRVVRAEDFFLGTFQTATADDEIVTQVSFGAPPTGAGWSFREVARKRGDFATVGVVCLVRRVADVVDWARIVLLSVGGTPYRATAAEDVLIGRDAGRPAVARAAAQAEIDSGGMRPVDDVHATAQYRTELAAALIEQAVAEAWERCA